MVTQSLQTSGYVARNIGAGRAGRASISAALTCDWVLVDGNGHAHLHVSFALAFGRAQPQLVLAVDRHSVIFEISALSPNVVFELPHRRVERISYGDVHVLVRWWWRPSRPTTISSSGKRMSTRTA